MLLAPREIQNSSILHGVDKTRIGPGRIGPDHGPDRGSDHGSDRSRLLLFLNLRFEFAREQQHLYSEIYKYNYMYGMIMYRTGCIELL